MSDRPNVAEVDDFSRLRLLQSTIIGVVLLHLLLIPGTAFFVEGTQVFQQMLQPHHANLNVSLLMIG